MSFQKFKSEDKTGCLSLVLLAHKNSHSVPLYSATSAHNSTSSLLPTLICFFCVGDAFVSSGGQIFFSRGENYSLTIVLASELRYM